MKKKIYQFMIVILMVLSILAIERYFDSNKKETLEKSSFNTFAIVEKTKESVRKSGKYKLNRKDVLYFGFLKNDTIFHKIKNFSNHFIERNNIKIGDVFEINVASSDYDIYEINFKSKPNEEIDIELFINIYETERHEKILAK